MRLTASQRQILDSTFKGTNTMKKIARIQNLQKMISIVKCQYNSGDIKYSSYVQAIHFYSRVLDRVLRTIV